MNDKDYSPLCPPPISRLPIELLDSIFTHTLLKDTRTTLLDDPLKPSRVISHVSNRWRAIALSNSRLWSEISLSKWRKRDRLPWIEEMIYRSSKAPVSLRLWIGDGWDEHWDRTFEPLLLGLISRIRELDIRMDYTLLRDANRLIRALSVNNAPLLESVSIAPYNICRSPADHRYLDLTFNSSMPKLRRVEYELNFDYIPQSSLSGLTYFKMTSISRYGNPGFSPDLCIALLHSMPVLQELYLLIEFNLDDEETLDNSEEVLRATLPHLKHLKMYASCHECAALLPRLTVGPGCTMDITCTDSEIDDAHETVRRALVCLAIDSALPMSDTLLEIDVQPEYLCILLSPLPPTPSAKIHPIFIFSTMLRIPDTDSDEESEEPTPPGIESIQYALLILVARTIHAMKLTRASVISLNVDVFLPIENYSAPVFGALIRACKSAKCLRLTGSRNGFMVPFLLGMVHGNGQAFDELLFKHLHNSQSWDPSALLELSLKPGFYWPVDSERLATPFKSESQLKMVNFLHADFDVATLEGVCYLASLVYWREQQVKIMNMLLWPVPCFSSSMLDGCVCVDSCATMADMMHYYLKPRDYSLPT